MTATAGYRNPADRLQLVRQGWRFWAHLAKSALEQNAGRQLIWAPVPLGCGIAVYFMLPFEPLLWGSGAAALASGIAFWVARGHRPKLAWLCLTLTLFALGFTSAIVRSLWVDAPQLERQTTPIFVEGRVIWVEEGPRRARILLDHVDLGFEDAAETPDRVRISSSVNADLPPIGSYVSIRAVLMPPSTEVMPGGFDFRRAAFFDRLGATGYAVGRWQIRAPPDLAEMPLKLASIRKNIAQRVRTVLPGPEGAVAVALLTGERYGVPEDLQDAFRVSGLAHLLAISGLHMSLLAVGVFMLVRRGCALSVRIVETVDTKKLAAVAALISTFVYLMLSGMGVSSQRAFFMVAIGLLAILVDRNPISLRLVAVAALAVLVFQPEALISVSFQMSFAAVICLVAGYEVIRSNGWLRSDRHRGWLGLLGFYMLGVLITDFIAGSATAPYAAYHFNRLPSYSLIANVLAVPVMGIVVMPMAIVTLAVLPFGLESLPLMLMGYGIGWIDAIAQMVAGWPGSSIRVPPAAPWAMGALTAGGLILCLLRGPLRLVGAPLVISACLQPWLAAKPALIVDADANGLAVTLQDGLVVSPDVPGFSRETWVRAYGRSGISWDDVAECDADGCVIALQGRTIAFSQTVAAMAEDCARADIVITKRPVRQNCDAGVVIDRFDLWGQGAHAIFLDESSETVISSRSDPPPKRPWSLAR